jgi:hypothetical protein
MGQWSEVSISPSSNYTTLVRTVASSYGYGGGFGFSIGGQQNAGTDSLYDETLATISVPGMVMYDISAQEWYNISTKPISFYETAITGSTHYVPSFGSGGLLFLLGGEAVSGRVVLYPDTLPHSPFSFEEIYMFDPSTRQWLSQATTGDRPSGVNYLCATGVQGDDNTYEVSMWLEGMRISRLTRVWQDYCLRRKHRRCLAQLRLRLWRRLCSLPAIFPLDQARCHTKLLAKTPHLPCCRQSADGRCWG